MREGKGEEKAIFWAFVYKEDVSWKKRVVGKSRVEGINGASGVGRWKVKCTKLWTKSNRHPIMDGKG
jgi:hypothetical protein